MPVAPTFDARLLRARALSPLVRELVFERVGGEFSFEAGQWVSLVLPLPDGELRRAYSIASAPDGSGRFEIAVTRVASGPGSTYLHALEPGAVLRAVGPQGFFTRPLASAPPSLFVATGTGVVPFRSMLGEAAAAGATTPCRLLFGVRDEADVLWRQELAALAARSPHFRFDVTLSRPGPSWKGRTGYVQEHAEEAWAELARAAGPGGPAPHVYVCGLERMVGAVRELFKKKLGLPRQQIHSERYD
jgi:ferredoxin-NADP reductase